MLMDTGLKTKTKDGARIPFPAWLKKSIEPGHRSSGTDRLITDLGLHTICRSGKCPNKNTCYSSQRAAFMILGDVCTRSCRFCSVTKGKPGLPDSEEPLRVAEAARKMSLRHVVVTSVTRDDLDDEGAKYFASTVHALSQLCPGATTEVLTPDFRRTCENSVKMIIEQKPSIFNHNIETVPFLYSSVRPQADYHASLKLLDVARGLSGKVLTKSGLMLGLGENKAQVLKVFRDLRQVGCQILSIGQYLKPQAGSYPVSRFVSPEEFEEYRQEALRAGFIHVESAPFVRSSFHAQEVLDLVRGRLKDR